MSDAPGAWKLHVCPSCEATAYGPEGATYCHRGHLREAMRPVVGSDAPTMPVLPIDNLEDFAG